MRWTLLWPTVVLLACGGGGRSEVIVSAASSLGDAFAEMEVAFETSHLGVDIVLNLGGSSALREQIRSGAPVDVFAPADPDDFAVLVAEGLTSASSQPFATNSLTIAVPAGNPGGVSGLADLARPELLVGLCAEPVPCGRFARAALEAAGVTPALDTEEPDVRALLTKIAAGELDVGLVYVTDVASAGRAVEAIAILAPRNTYVIAALDGDPDASEFVDFVMSAAGRAILADHGFGVP